MSQYPKTLALIMAQGHGRRWQADGRNKLLLTICDEPLIHRQVRQIKTIAPDVCIYIIGNPEELGPCPTGAAYHYLRIPGPEVCDGMLQTGKFWSNYERVVFLMGDAVFSWRVMMAIFQETIADGFRVFGRVGLNAVTGKPYDERFAVAVSAKQYPALEHHLKLVVADNECRGVLKSLYHNIVGGPHVPIEPIETPTFPILWENIILWVIPEDDYTDDFDSPLEYERGRPLVEAAIAKG